MSGRDYLTFAMNNSEHKKLISHYLLLKFCGGKLKCFESKNRTTDRGCLTGDYEALALGTCCSARCLTRRYLCHTASFKD
jgi:hypothetical protein